MRTPLLIPIAGLFLLSACNIARKPSAANFTTAINQYLAKHGQACTLIGRQFPVDVPRSGASNLSGLDAKLATLQDVGLVSETDTTAVVHGMLDPLRGPTPPQPVRRYELTAEGQRYFRQIQGIFGPSTGFCYGQKTVDSIVKWTEPEAALHSQAEVTYTYKIVNLAAWAERPDVQQVFPDIRATINETSKTNQIVGVQLTNKSWEVPGQ
jgi:hypothetical protein